MKRRFLWFGALFVFIAALVISGCAGSQPARFYMLVPLSEKGDQGELETRGINSRGIDQRQLDPRGTDQGALDQKKIDQGKIDQGEMEQRKIERDVKMESSQGRLSENLVVGVGPVTLANYLDRSQLIVRIAPHEVRLEEFHQWAAPLKDEIPLILVENLHRRLGIDTIYIYPWKSYLKPDYQIHIEIVRFDGPVDGPVTLSARWEIYKGGERMRMASEQVDLIEPLSENQDTSAHGGERYRMEGKIDSETFEKRGLNAYVAAQSRILGRLSDLIARSLRIGVE